MYSLKYWTSPCLIQSCIKFSSTSNWGSRNVGYTRILPNKWGVVSQYYILIAVRPTPGRVYDLSLKEEQCMCVALDKSSSRASHKWNGFLNVLSLNVHFSGQVEIVKWASWRVDKGTPDKTRKIRTSAVVN